MAAASFVLVAALLAVGLYTKRASIHPDMKLSLAVLFLLYLTLPSVLFSSYGADRRLLVMVALVLVRRHLARPVPSRPPSDPLPQFLDGETGSGAVAISKEG